MKQLLDRITQYLPKPDSLTSTLSSQGKRTTLLVMDLLSSAYSTASDDEDSVAAAGPPPSRQFPPPPKRAKLNLPYNHSTNPTRMYNPPRIHEPTPTRTLPPEPPLPGRYISKREQAALAPATSPTESSNPVYSSILGSISDANIPQDILSRLRSHKNGSARFGPPAERSSIVLNGHMRPVNALQWSNSHAHLLASAGMDNTISIWNVWSREKKQARVLKCHSAAVKDVQWSPQGIFTLSCGYDCTSRLVDVEKGVETQSFMEDQMIGVVKYHPENCNLFISGGSKGHLKLWDVRSGKVVHEYVRNLGPILDVEFTVDGKHFISSSDVSRSNISENAIVVWDISRQVPVSNQVYVEAYTCTCIRSHPYDPYFIAQSNGNYIAIFSSKPPFKLDKYKRFESHGVSGFPIKCNFSRDGDKIASGSSDGCVYIYDSRSARLIEKIKAFAEPCVDAAFHPVMPDVVASCSWNGSIKVFE